MACKLEDESENGSEPKTSHESDSIICIYLGLSFSCKKLIAGKWGSGSPECKSYPVAVIAHGAHWDGSRRGLEGAEALTKICRRKPRRSPGALLEKQIVIVCSNLGVLSASVLLVLALIRPYQWHNLLMPVLPNDMLDFLDAPVPYIISSVGHWIKIDTISSRLLLAKLVGESYLAQRRPVYECTDVQIEAAKGFLAVIRLYLDSFCSNLRSHTITNAQSNNDKVSVLLTDSYMDSFPYHDRPFMKD
ncbi:uncharacterized protein LOC121995501 [Zingiber officinale]|uniref:uncharacterized protein LOC121995501 n=1 Tax=Zingiber officinale TaxID=94328 RepID=UPI001C4CA35B|nr:uncharacterized protein LOC121995501 [Zingiber officinale]